MKIRKSHKRDSIASTNTLSPVAKMCLWFKRKPDVESNYDQRVGNSNITSPIPGAYADPVSPPVTITVGSIPTPEPTPVPRQQLQSISELSRQSHPEQRRNSSKVSPRTSEAPSQLTQQAQSSPHQPSQQSSHDSQQSQNTKRLSNSTQFSSHHSISGSPSPELSPKWFKSPDTAQNTSQPPSQQQSPANSPGHAPSSRERNHSTQSSDSAAPAPMPVHQAYISPDQLSIGAKLSPSLTANGSPTPPTTGGLNTGHGSFSHGYGNSTTASPIDGRNPWGTKSAQTSPIDGRNPWNSHRESMNSTSAMLHGSHSIKEEEKAAVKPPWERKMPVAVVPLPAQPAPEKPGDAKAKEEARKEERNRMTKIHIPIPGFILGNAPKRGERQQRQMDMSPDTASPQTTTSTKTTEQWPGEM